MYISVTSFKVKSIWAHFIFQAHALSSFRQARKSTGILKTEKFSPSRRVYNTLTHWRSEANRLKFRGSVAHLKAIKMSNNLGRGITTGWNSNTFVNREEACQKLQTVKGKLN